MLRLLIACLLLGALACGEKKENTAPVERTDREKAEIVAGSGLPGTRPVGKLLTATDSIQARNDRLESMVPPR